MAKVIYHDVKPTQRCARLSECNGILYYYKADDFPDPDRTGIPLDRKGIRHF